ncbi:helix-turn-helix transcriptional regulator [Pseudomonas chlororaphis]|uniref:helix-turn-helix domain-containing protein n=1 Tax=Pseudomonas chlororaphis TaxID=587753 RepID=UPI0030B984DE
MRKSRHLSQEDFGGCSSQTYLSQLEGGGKGPTLEKVDALASVMDVHPLTVLMRCYLLRDDTATLESLITRIREEVTETPPL